MSELCCLPLQLQMVNTGQPASSALAFASPLCSGTTDLHLGSSLQFCKIPDLASDFTVSPEPPFFVLPLSCHTAKNREQDLMLMTTWLVLSAWFVLGTV